MAEITKDSVRIIIDIPNAKNFRWSAAASLWAEHMGRQGTGFSENYGYVWYAVNPLTNKPLVNIHGEKFRMPMIGTCDDVILSEIFGDFYQRLDRIETIALRLKTTPGAASGYDRSELLTDIATLRADAQRVSDVKAVPE